MRTCVRVANEITCINDIDCTRVQFLPPPRVRVCLANDAIILFLYFRLCIIIFKSTGGTTGGEKHKYMFHEYLIVRKLGYNNNNNNNNTKSALRPYCGFLWKFYFYFTEEGRQLGNKADGQDNNKTNNEIYIRIYVYITRISHMGGRDGFQLMLISTSRKNASA